MADYKPKKGEMVRLMGDFPKVEGQMTIEALQVFEVVEVRDPEDQPGKEIALSAVRGDGERAHFLGGHACDGLVEEGSGWWARPDNLEPV